MYKHMASVVSLLCLTFFPLFAQHLCYFGALLPVQILPKISNSINCFQLLTFLFPNPLFHLKTSTFWWGFFFKMTSNCSECLAGTGYWSISRKNKARYNQSSQCFSVLLAFVWGFFSQECPATVQDSFQFAFGENYFIIVVCIPFTPTGPLSDLNRKTIAHFLVSIDLTPNISGHGQQESDHQLFRTNQLGSAFPLHLRLHEPAHPYIIENSVSMQLQSYH